ncbi:MAG: alpha/beta hydrolase family protein [Candidatus Nanopelagicales bacterium]
MSNFAGRRGLFAAGLVAVAVANLSNTGATADPLVDTLQPAAYETAPDGSKLVLITKIDDRNVKLTVSATSMQRDVEVYVQRPADTSKPSPTLYLLDGLTRKAETDNLTFLAGKNVNVVIPTGGENAYWTDWAATDPLLGVNKWRTFLTQELPPIVDAALGANGVNAIAGMSRTGTAALQLAIAKPGLYKSVASYSACPGTSDPVGRYFVELSMQQYGGGNPVNMWGAASDPLWAANDPALHAEGLRGTNLYLSNGSGLPGVHDRLDDPRINGRADTLLRQIIAGGGIEAATDYCNHTFVAKLAELGIPATINFPLTGNHSWGYWQDDFIDSWPVLARGLGIS